MTKILFSEGWKRTTRRWLWGMLVGSEDFPGGPGQLLVDPDGCLTYVVECPGVPLGLVEFCRRRGVRVTVHLAPGALVRVEYREPLCHPGSHRLTGLKRKSGPAAQ